MNKKQAKALVGQKDTLVVSCRVDADLVKQIKKKYGKVGTLAAGILTDEFRKLK
jgi:hypothetical protein